MSTTWNWLTALPAWQANAACKGAGSVWFDGDAASVTEAKSICAQCPVLAECLDYALSLPAGQAEHGIWGGCGENDRRAFRRVRSDRTHEGARLVDGCGCRWCGLLRVHHARLDGADLPLRTFGPRATHGRRVTFARGCRCGPCSLAAVLPDAISALIPARTPTPNREQVPA